MCSMPLQKVRVKFQHRLASSMEPSSVFQDINSVPSACTTQLRSDAQPKAKHTQSSQASAIEVQNPATECQVSVCDILGITFTSKDDFLKTLGSVSSENFTNEAVFEIWMQLFKGNQKKNDLQVSWLEIKQAIGCMYGVDLISMPPSYIRKSFEDVKNNRRRFIKRKPSSILKNFMGQPWKLPERNIHLKDGAAAKEDYPDHRACDPPKDAKSESFTEQADKETLGKLGKEYNQLLQAYTALEKRNKELKERNKNLMEENTLLRQRITAWNPKRTNQALKRKQQSISSWVTKYRTLKLNYQNEVGKRNKDLKDSLRKVKGAANKQVKRLKTKQKIQGIKYEQLAQGLTNELKQAVAQGEQRSKETYFWQNEAVQMKEKLDEKEPDTLPTKINSKTYTQEVREASYLLQDVGVSQQNVSKTIKAVVKSMTGKDLCGPLPSYTTQNNFTKEMKSVSQRQIAALIKQSKNLTLKYDGTTKKVGHLVETEIQTDDHTLLIGIRQQSGGTADEYATTIKESINAIESASETADPRISARIVNTMTDRCKTNDAVDRKLEDHFGHELNSFRCAMHPLDGMAKECEKVIKSFEEEMKISENKKTEKYPYQHRAESNSQATVRCASKLFYDPQFNCEENLVAHLKSKGQVPGETSNSNIVFHRFVGNRFHIYFLDSGLLYHYTKSINEFFSLVCPPQNVVQQCVLNALKLEVLQVTLRALGIIGKCITGPWMRLLGNNKTILEMNIFYAEAQEKTKSWSTDASPLLSPHPPSVFETIPIKEDAVLESLLTPTSLNDITVNLLQNLCAVILVLIERQLHSQLPGGVFWDAAPDVQQQAKSCSATNISGERNFARVDQAIYHAKNASTGHIEAKVMFRANNTAKWLAELNVNDKKYHISHAMKGARAISEEEKARKAQLSKQIRERIQLARQRQQSKDDSQREKVEQWFTLAYNHGGVWLTSQEVKENSDHLSKTKAKVLLKAQINIRIKILKCEPDKENKVPISKATVAELQRYMINLLNIEEPEQVHDLLDIIAAPESLIGMLFVHQWIIDDEMSQYDGSIVEYKKADGMFTVMYDRETTPTYISPAELITDVVRGDLELCQA